VSGEPKAARADPPVVAIVVTYNSAGYIGACLDSLAKSPVPLDVVVVDNGSSDGTAAAVRRAHPSVVVVAQANLGYAGGNNAGLARACDTGCRYAFIVNPDVVIDPGCVAHLVAHMDAHPDVAIACPKILRPDRRTIWFAGATINWEEGVSNHRGQDQPDEGQFDEAGPMDRACGAAMLVRMSAVERVGRMPEDYFLYFEEMDWSLRFVAAGYGLAYVPSASCLHDASSSTGHMSPLVYYYMTRNNLLFMSRFGRDHWASFSAALRRRSLFNVRWWLARPSAGNLCRVWAVARGYADFRLGRLGRRW